MTITGTAPNQSVSFGIPQGNPGLNGTGSGTVVGPATSTAGNVPSFADGSGQNMSDSGVAASSLATKTALAAEAASRATADAFNFCAGIAF